MDFIGTITNPNGSNEVASVTFCRTHKRYSVALGWMYNGRFEMGSTPAKSYASEKRARAAAAKFFAR